MPPGGAEDLNGRDVPALDTEDRAGPGEGGLPGNLEINALEAVRGAGLTIG
jgi:hypothetical protein